MADRAKKHLNADEVLKLALDLISSVSSAPDQRLPVQSLLDALSIDRTELMDLLELISFVSDSASGARPIIVLENDGVSIRDRFTEVESLRLSQTASDLLNALLEQEDLPGGGARVRAAIDPVAREAAPSFSQASNPYGRHYAAVCEAIDDGIRCTMRYEGVGDAEARWRLIDPHDVFTERGRWYLGAWDVEKDAERTFRLDNILELSFTDDSVVDHPYSGGSIAQDLREHGFAAVLKTNGAATSRVAGWRGATPLPSRGEGVFEIRYGSEAWLFERVLAAAGTIRIEEPPELRERFVTFARQLLDT